MNNKNKKSSPGDVGRVGTKSGRKFSFLKSLQEGDPSEIDIRDIAWALSLINRFNGHSEWPYSVGQHSLVVSKIVHPRYALIALLHDATEAYLGDVSSPLKKELQRYKELEQMAWERIAAAFGLPMEIPDAVHRADKQALALERRILVPHDRTRWEMLTGFGAPRRSEVTNLVVPMDHRVVYTQFLDRFEELMSLQSAGRQLKVV